MFFRLKNSGERSYIQIVESKRVDGTVFADRGMISAATTIFPPSSWNENGEGGETLALKSGDWHSCCSEKFKCRADAPELGRAIGIIGRGDRWEAFTP